jgi:hypothetical protein
MIEAYRMMIKREFEPPNDETRGTPLVEKYRKGSSLFVEEFTATCG